MKASRKVSDHPIIALTGPDGGFPNRAIVGSPIWHPGRKRFEMIFSGLDARRSGPPFRRVHGAHSPDGVRWTLAKGGPPRHTRYSSWVTRDIIEGPIEFAERFIPQPDTRGRFRWDSGSIGTPGACPAPDGKVLLWYSAPQDGDGARIGAVFIDP